MIPYKALDCPNYDNINNAILDYAKKHTNLLNNPDPDFEVKYCNFVDSKHFILHNPLLREFFDDIGVRLRDIYYTLTWNNPIRLHLDKPPVCWKMNWPVLNMENTAVRFFKLKDQSQNIDDYVRRTGDPSSKDFDNYELPYEPFEEQHRFRFDNKKPVIMNGQIPHDVGYYEGVRFPRLGIQVMFFSEPVHLL